MPGDVGPPIVLLGLLLLPDVTMPKPSEPNGGCRPPLPRSVCEDGLEPLGVPVGVVWLLSTRDLREDDLGVTLLAMKAFAGVDNSSRGGGDLIGADVGAALFASGGVAEAAASRGVMGDLRLRFEARVGISGFVVAALLLLLLLLSAFFNGIIAADMRLSAHLFRISGGRSE